VPVLADFAMRRGITYPLLSDAGSAVITRYGILNTTVPDNSPQRGIPYPGTFIVDANGVVTSRVFEGAYQERNTVTSVLAKLGSQIDVAAKKVTAPHLTLTTYVTDSSAAPGTHFSLVVDVTPARRVHVYAPGVTGYKPIALAVDPQPALVIRGAQVPASEDYYFKPLDEHVAVYQKPFRIVQDLEIDPSPAAAPALADRTAMKMTGTLTYQACDDKVCFNPQAVPLEWTIALKPLDRERVKR